MNLDPSVPPAPAVTCVGIAVYDILAGPLTGEVVAGSLSLVEHFDVAIGGCAVNCADALTVAGVPTRLVAAVGDDVFGSYIQHTVAERGIDARWVTSAELPTSTSAILVDSVGERTIIHCVGASAALTVDAVDPHVAGDVLYVGGALVLPGLDGAPLADLLGRARARGMATVLDVVHDPSGRWDRVVPALEHVDVFTPNAIEAAAITGASDPATAAAELRRMGVQVAVVTLAAEGAWIDCDDYVGPVAPHPVDAVDETGSGDAFDAGMILGLVHRLAPPAAARVAAVMGALASTATGACAAHLSFDEIWDRAGLDVQPR